ncbi:hypothetical protein C8F01DRAFT_1366195 [Mycena amicta]|nr:hypothetical protein C8F01DRAFT_1366195 [Mycena amicta]
MSVFPHYVHGAGGLGPALIAACNDSGCQHSKTCAMSHIPHYFALKALAPVQTPCFFFQKGNCANGDDCRFSHSAADGQSPRTGLNNVKCKFFASNAGCKNGDACPFIHDASQSPISATTAPANSATANVFQPCTFRATGSCARGDSCIISHDPSSPIYSPIPSTSSPLISAAGGWMTWDASRDPKDDDNIVTAETSHTSPEVQLTRVASSSSPRSKLPCRYYPQGRCRWGSDCQFLHDPEQIVTDTQTWGRSNSSNQQLTPPDLSTDWDADGGNEESWTAGATGWGNETSTAEGRETENNVDWGQQAPTDTTTSWLQETDENPAWSTDAHAGATWTDTYSAANHTTIAIDADQPEPDNIPSVDPEAEPSWSLPWPRYDSLPPTKREENCLFFGQGHCSKGDNCEYRHVRQDDLPDLAVPREPTPPPPTEVILPPTPVAPLLPRSIFNCKAEISDGAVPLNIVTSFESAAIILSDYPAGMCHDDVLELVEPYGTVVNTTFQLRNGKVQARVEFADHSQAEDARYNLHGLSLDEQNLSVKLDCRDSVYGSAHQTPAQLRLTWSSPSVSAWVFYPKVALSKSESKRLDGTTFHGRKISAEYCVPRQKDRFPISVKGLPVSTKQDELQAFCGGDKVSSVTLSPPNYTTPQHNQVLAFLRPYGKIRSFDVLPADLKITAFVEFLDADAAARAKEALTGLKHHFLGDEEISVHDIVHVRYPCASLPVQVFRPELDELLKSSSTSCTVQWVDSSRTLHIYGRAQKVGSMVKSAQSFIFGSDLSLWDPYFNMDASDNKIQDINNSSSRSFHVQKDERRQVLRVWGDQRKAAKQMGRLLKTVEANRHRLPLNSIQLTGMMNDGLGNEANSSKVMLDVPGKSLTVFGDERKVVDRLAVLSMSSVVPNVDSTTSPCCLCISRDGDGLIELACSHRYCLICFKEAFRLVQFPATEIRCVGKHPDTEEDCSAMIPASLLLSHLTDAEFHRAAFLSFARSDPNMRFCPSGCDVAFRLGRPGMALSCPDCGINICASCALPNHSGLSCAECVDLDTAVEQA